MKNEIMKTIHLSNVDDISDNLEDYLSLFDNYIGVKVSLDNGESFYFEKLVSRDEKMSYAEHKELGLKFHHIIICVHKPHGTEDFIEMKNFALRGKIRFLIWIADIFYKYNVKVPDIIQNKIMLLNDGFDVVEIRHQTPSNFMEIN